MQLAQKPWIGYLSSGGRATLDLGHGQSRVALLGESSSVLTAVCAVAAKEAGSPLLIMDLSGSVAARYSGHFDAYDYRSFLYDAFRLAEPGPWHAQLVAGAYAAVLDLSSEEEAILGSALQQVASQGDLASPVSLYDLMGKVEGFRGFYIDRLKGRIGSLKLFDAVDDRSVDRLLGGCSVVDFHMAPYPQAAELASALLIAKVVALQRSEGTEVTLALTEAHRLFKLAPRLPSSGRLLVELLSSRLPALFATDQPQATSRHLLEACHQRVHSGTSWHSQRDPRTPILAGSMVLEDLRTGIDTVFFPRRIDSKTSDYASARPARLGSPALTSMILEEVSRYPLSTGESIVQFLSAEFLPADVRAEIDSLHSRECLVMEPKDSGAGPKVFAFTATEKGLALLRELKG